MSTNNSNAISYFEDEDSAPYVLHNKKLGPSSSQCTVRKASKRAENPRVWSYAQKTIELDHDSMVPQVRQAFLEEVKILRQAQHHHVVEFIDAYEVGETHSEKSQLAIVMDLADGNIQDFLLGRKQSPSDLESMGHWFICLASVVDYIHAIGIRHRDIKPQNILVDDTKKVLLADFGISTMGLAQTLSTTLPQWARSRTRSHCAPEVEDGSSRGRSADIFSLGAVFLEILLARSHPATKLPELDKKARPLKEEPTEGKPTEGKSYAKHVDRLHQWMEKQLSNWNEEMPNMQTAEDFRMFSLCKDMLHKDREQRPKAFQVLDTLLQGSLPSSPGQCRCGQAPRTAEKDLVYACRAGSLGDVRRIISNGLEPSKIGALQQAAVHGHLSIVEFLLDSGADVDLRDYSSQTALHCAAGAGHDNIVETLIRHGATATLLDIGGRTALHHAAGCDRPNVVEMLLGKVDVTVQDEHGQTALHFAAKRGHKEAAQHLLTGLSDDDRKRYACMSDRKSQTALHFAAGCGSESVVGILLENGANPSWKDSKRQTALHFAACGTTINGEYEAVGKLLLENGVDVMELDEMGRSAFYRARGGGSLEKLLAKVINGKAEAHARELETVPAMTQVKMSEGLLADFHTDLLSFLAIAQYHKTDIWPISWDNSLRELGKGATGDVRQSLLGLNSHYAFKRFAKHREHHAGGFLQYDILPDSVTSSEFESSHKLFTALISELVILNQPEVKRNPHIVQIDAITVDIEDVVHSQGSVRFWPVLVLKKAQHGSLKKYMDSEGRKLDLQARLDFCIQIASAISTMHSLHIVHGDVKPQNVLVYQDKGAPNLRLTDFSYSCFGTSDGDIVKPPKSLNWHAPEHSSKGVKIEDAKLMDTYSFGMVCLWLLFPNIHEEFSQGGQESFDKQADIEAVVQKVTSTQDSMLLSTHEALAEFFRQTICQDPSKRQKDWCILVKLLGYKSSQIPSGQTQSPTAIVGPSRPLTLADYDATAQDINDPERFQALKMKIFSSLSVSGGEIDAMWEWLSSASFRDEMKTSEHFNSSFKKLAPYQSYSRERDNRPQGRGTLKHNCPTIGFDIFYQLILQDYRFRVYLFKCLQERASGQCDQCARSAASELAFCYKIGFGVSSNALEAEKWLRISNTTSKMLDQRLEFLKNLSKSDLNLRVGLKIVDGQSCGRSLSRNVWGVSATKKGRTSAENYMNREIHELQQHLGEHHWILFELKLDLIGLLSVQRKSQEAVTMAEELEVSSKEAYGFSHDLHVRAALNLAYIYWRRSRWDEAEALILSAKKWLGVDETHKLGAKNQLSVETCLALAGIYADRGKMERAEKEFADLFNAVKKAPGLHSFHPLVHEVTRQYSRCLRDRKKFPEAIGLFKQVLPGPESDIQARCIALIETHNKGFNNMSQGNTAAAEATFSKLQVDAENLVEEAEYTVAAGWAKWALKSAKYDLARVFVNQGRFVEAEELLNDLMATLNPDPDQIQRELDLGVNWLDTTFLLATALKGQRKWDLAERLHLRVKKLRQDLRGPTHEETEMSGVQLAWICEAQGRHDEAEKEWETVMKARVERTGMKHIYPMKTMTETMKKSLLKSGKPSLAEENTTNLLNSSTSNMRVRVFASRPLSEDEQFQLGSTIPMPTFPGAAKGRGGSNDGGHENKDHEEMVRKAMAMFFGDEELSSEASHR